MGAEIQIASHDRLAGYRAALASYDLTPEPASLVQGDFSFESGVACGRALLAGRELQSADHECRNDQSVSEFHGSPPLHDTS
jgi:LacI family transcriptional regulator